MQNASLNVHGIKPIKTRCYSSQLGKGKTYIQLGYWSFLLPTFYLCFDLLFVFCSRFKSQALLTIVYLSLARSPFGKSFFFYLIYFSFPLNYLFTPLPTSFLQSLSFSPQPVCLVSPHRCTLFPISHQFSIQQSSAAAFRLLVFFQSLLDSTIVIFHVILHIFYAAYFSEHFCRFPFSAVSQHKRLVANISIVSQSGDRTTVLSGNQKLFYLTCLLLRPNQL